MAKILAGFIAGVVLTFSWMALAIWPQLRNVGTAYFAAPVLVTLFICIGAIALIVDNWEK